MSNSSHRQQWLHGFSEPRNLRNFEAPPRDLSLSASEGSLEGSYLIALGIADIHIVWVEPRLAWARGWTSVASFGKYERWETLCDFANINKFIFIESWERKVWRLRFKVGPKLISYRLS